MCIDVYYIFNVLCTCVFLTLQDIWSRQKDKCFTKNSQITRLRPKVLGRLSVHHWWWQIKTNKYLRGNSAHSWGWRSLIIYTHVNIRPTLFLLPHADPGDNSGGTVHHVLSKRMYRPNISTVLAYVPSRQMYRPGVCTVPAYVPSRRMYHPNVCNCTVLYIPSRTGSPLLRLNCHGLTVEAKWDHLAQWMTPSIWEIWEESFTFDTNWDSTYQVHTKRVYCNSCDLYSWAGTSCTPSVFSHSKWVRTSLANCLILPTDYSCYFVPHILLSF